jgi:hypothetical protein
MPAFVADLPIFPSVPDSKSRPQQICPHHSPTKQEAHILRDSFLQIHISMILDKLSYKSPEHIQCETFTLKDYPSCRNQCSLQYILCDRRQTAIVGDYRMYTLSYNVGFEIVGPPSGPPRPYHRPSIRPLSL